MNASLAAAVGGDLDLFAELRAAFLESAARQADLMERVLKGELIKLSHIEKELADAEASAAAD